MSASGGPDCAAADDCCFASDDFFEHRVGVAVDCLAGDVGDVQVQTYNVSSVSGCTSDDRLVVDGDLANKGAVEDRIGRTARQDRIGEGRVLGDLRIVEDTATCPVHRHRAGHDCWCRRY